MTNFSWLWESWRLHFSGPWLDPALALAAMLCGLLVGNERHRREKPAGIRTLTLVCLGSCLFTMVSFAFTTTTGDSGRVAAQIVTGIGFLGAGVILHGRRFVSGVTTAAIIWVGAGIGMTVGAGYPVAALALSLLVNRFLVLVLLFETKWHPTAQATCYTLEYAPKSGLTRLRLERILIDYETSGVDAKWSPETAESGAVVLRMALPRVHRFELLAELIEVPDVHAMHREPDPATAA